MSDNTLENEISIMKLEVYKRVKYIKKKRIFKEFKSFKLVKSLRMVGDWFLTKKIK